MFGLHINCSINRCSLSWGQRPCCHHSDNLLLHWGFLPFPDKSLTLQSLFPAWPNSTSQVSKANLLHPCRLAPVPGGVRIMLACLSLAETSVVVVWQENVVFLFLRGCSLVLLTLPNCNAIVVLTIKRHFSALPVWLEVLKKFLGLASRPRSGSVYWRGQTLYSQGIDATAGTVKHFCTTSVLSRTLLQGPAWEGLWVLNPLSSDS